MSFARPTPDSDRERSPRPLAGLLALGRPLIMGILNVTPDSFFDGGRFCDPATAVAQARRMIGEGADIIDIGAESSRPYAGALAVPLEEEMRRLAPVLPQTVALGTPVSIDTMKAEVAAWAVAAGATIVNDVWGLQRDRELAGVVAEHGVPIVVVHNRDSADPAIDIMGDIADFFHRSLAIAAPAGIVVAIDLGEASRSDKLAHTVGYDQVVEVASRAFCARRYKLVETAAGAVAGALLERFRQVKSVRITVHKPHAPIAASFADVGVTLVRARGAHG